MISVIIVSHNYGRFLSKCLTSILSNNVDYLKEIIIVDDSSEDNTFDVAKNFFQKNSRIKYFKKNFKSLSKSTNFGINQAQAEWVTKIDADDYVSENFLENFSREIIKRKLDFAYGDIIQMNNDKQKTIKQNYSKKSILKYPLGSGTIFRKKLWESVNGFNEKLYFQDDFDFWLRVKNNNRFSLGYINQAHYFYRKHGSNMSDNKIKKNLTKIAVILKNCL